MTNAIETANAQHTYLRTVQNPYLGALRVYEDGKYGDMEPFVVFDSRGVELNNDYYDIEDIKHLDHDDY